jgi:hypothetical protein
MANEINGTTCLLYRKTGPTTYTALVGQLEITANMLGNTIDVSSKNDNDFVKIMAGELGSKGQNVTGNIIYSSDAEFRAMRELAIAGDSAKFKIDFTGNDADAIYIIGIPTAMTDTLPTGDKVTTAITILSLSQVHYGDPL